MKPKTFLPTLLLCFVGYNLFAQKTYVPDDYFEMILIDMGYDSGELNDSVPTENIKYIRTLDISQKNISDLTGIEDFESLEYLRFTSNKISIIDVSKNQNLKILDCLYNQITDLDVSKNLKLNELYCGYNPLTTLDVSHNSALAILWCYYSNLTSLNLESNLALRELFCQQNKIEELDVSKNINLKDIWCHANHMRRLNLKNGKNYYLEVKAINNPDLLCIQVDHPVLSAGYSGWQVDAWVSYSTDCSDFNIEKTYIPDDNFEQALIDLGYDSGEPDDSINTAKIEAIKELDISNRNISTLKGIEAFKNLSVLICPNNQISSLDLSYNSVLTKVACYNNKLSKLNLKNGNNRNMIVHLQKNPDLLCVQVDDAEAAYKNSNWIKDAYAAYSEDCLMHKPQMTYIPDDNFEKVLIVGGYDTGELDDSVQTNVINKIKTLLIHDKNISDLTGIEDFTAVTRLYCEHNKISKLNVSTLTNLNFLRCDYNNISDLDLSTNSALTQLIASSNNLSRLNLKNNNNSNLRLEVIYNPNLTCIEVDDPVLSAGYSDWFKDKWASYTRNCLSLASDIITACDKYVWIDGNTYTSNNNTATYTLSSIDGNDSIIRLDLTILRSTAGVDIQTACNSYKWIDGNTYTESNNTASYTLTNAAGCDSIVTLDLAILNSTGVDVQTACDFFTWIDGKTYTESNNTATYTLTNNAGCDSIATLNLDIIKIDKSLANNDSTIIAIQGNATYQWLDCNNDMSIIEGAKSQFYKVSKSGNYAVEISLLGCIDTTACYSLTLVGIDQINFKNVNVFPNPSDGNININFGGLQNPIIRVLTLNGKLVYEQTEIYTNEMKLDLDIASGIYLIEIYSESEKKVYKFVKK